MLPKLDTTGTLPNVCLILPAMYRFKPKISLRVLGYLVSMSWRALSPVHTTKSTLPLKLASSQSKVALTSVSGASHSLFVVSGKEGHYSPASQTFARR